MGANHGSARTTREPIDNARSTWRGSVQVVRDMAAVGALEKMVTEEGTWIKGDGTDILWHAL